MKDKAFVGASLLAALAASLCCILPIIFAVAGAGIIGASAFFAAWRPYLLGVTAVLLAAGFYFAYRTPKHPCEPGSACEVPSVNKKGRIGLWIATVFVVGFATFPYYSGPVAQFVLGSVSAKSSEAPQLAQVTFAVQGMDCSACAAAIESRLKSTPGVKTAHVSYENKRADIEFDQTKVSVEQLQKAIAEAGYRSTKS
jgi:copper chaperone CopZ